MPSIHRRKDSQYWHAAFIYPDGQRTLRSTGTSDKRKAMTICLEWARAAQLAKEGRLTATKSRDALSDILRRVTGEGLPNATVRAYLADWLTVKTEEIADRSLEAYTKAVQDFLAFLGSKADQSMDAVSTREVAAFRAELVRRVSPATANKVLAALRGAWTTAVRDKMARENPFADVGKAKTRTDTPKRRAFTLDEIRKLLTVCNAEWRAMTLCGLYVGQRLMDMARLTWRQVDLSRREMALTTGKTGRNMTIPLAAPLVKELLALPSADDLDAPLFPNLSTLAQTTVSNQFAALLAKAGLVEKKAHRKMGDGRDKRREGGGLCYHCLRHSMTSMLKNAGVSNAVAMELVGHDTEAVSRTYTHIETATLRKAVDLLPDVTSGSEA